MYLGEQPSSSHNALGFVDGKRVDFSLFVGRCKQRCLVTGEHDAVDAGNIADESLHFAAMRNPVDTFVPGHGEIDVPGGTDHHIVGTAFARMIRLPQRDNGPVELSANDALAEHLAHHEPSP
jgi:hypothetical protein